MAQAEFALKLLRDSGPSGSFVILSPFSISVALAMVYAGADGKTKIEIGDALAKGAKDEEIVNYFSALMMELSKEGDGYKLLAANKLYVQEHSDILQSFKDVIKEKFDGQLQEVDFSKATETAKIINEWVEKKTNAKIKNLISPDMLTVATTLALVNAIYFKGDWATKFDVHRTMKKQFHVAENQNREIEMMTVTQNFLYTEDETMQVLGLPYKSGVVSMFVFLPKKKFGLAEVEKSLSGEKLIALINSSAKDNKIIIEMMTVTQNFLYTEDETMQVLGLPYKSGVVSMFVFLPKKKFALAEVEKSLSGEKLIALINSSTKDNKIIVELPKFKLESKFELRTTLEQLGIHDAFTSSANFSDISAKPLIISHVIHQAFIETNEEGTEAAAATAILMSRSMRPLAATLPIKFIADHPFIFAIVKNNHILFIGRFH
uniref:Serpin domain-containing protein n=1 Tax=Ascaris lumbricoides TaxID=6252 RepID=A0A9J2Q118_ASCLU